MGGDRIKCTPRALIEFDMSKKRNSSMESCNNQGSPRLISPLKQRRMDLTMRDFNTTTIKEE